MEGIPCCAAVSASVPVTGLLWWTVVDPDPTGKLWNDGSNSGSEEGWSVCTGVKA